MAGTLIRDKYSRMKGLSRQQRYQLRMREKKRCILCGDKVEGDTLFCSAHLTKKREYERKRTQKKAG